MTFGVREPARSQIWVAPGSALVFSILMAVLAPRYPTWFGDALPRFTHVFLTAYPLWIAISVLAVIVSLLTRTLHGERAPPAWLRTLDGLLGIVSIAIVVVGIIALALPALGAPAAI